MGTASTILSMSDVYSLWYGDLSTTCPEITTISQGCFMRSSSMGEGSGCHVLHHFTNLTSLIIRFLKIKKFSWKVFIVFKRINLIIDLMAHKWTIEKNSSAPKKRNVTPGTYPISTLRAKREKNNKERRVRQKSYPWKTGRSNQPTPCWKAKKSLLVSMCILR